ncbi:MAG TPA: TetR/AcrR family transcriptional regulator [Candidatus Acidoferrum sp.]|jgi:AcrR family transcriptional regulator|nr:TetR/AcrR family transcriptional regulator [Candidatus Acidoferrum sp.]
MGASSPTNFKARLTQDEKTAETRRRLLDAAIVCLVERGYANTTTSEIAERAGLSRGAQLYHFPKKEELLTSAVEHLFSLMFGEMKEKVGRLTSENDRRAVAIDSLWEIANGRLATAWIELVVASRTDEYLRESVSAVNDRMAEFIDQSFKELFPRPDGVGEDYELIPQIAVLILEAMALEGRTLNPQLAARILHALKTVKL